MGRLRLSKWTPDLYGVVGHWQPILFFHLVHSFLFARVDLFKHRTIMTVPLKYINTYAPVKYFLTSYRALSDGKTGIRHLEEHLESSAFSLSEWKVSWIGACALLRSSVAVFQIDAKSCIDPKIRQEIRSEWDSIKLKKEHHPIFWEFLRKERDNILHQYEWAAYEVWMDQDGATRPPRMSLLEVKPKDVSAVLVMRGGPYKGRNSLGLLKESAEWVEARISGAIRRAGFDPDEERNLVNFQKRPPLGASLPGR